MRPLLQCSLREWEKRGGTRVVSSAGFSRLSRARAAHHHSAHRVRDAVHVGGGGYVCLGRMSNQITSEAQRAQSPQSFAIGGEKTVRYFRRPSDRSSFMTSSPLRLPHCWPTWKPSRDTSGSVLTTFCPTGER